MVLPRMTRMSIVFRTLCGIGIVGSVITAGATLRSPWIILPLGLAFAVLFVIGKWETWRLAQEQFGWKAIPMGIVSTVGVQLVMVAVLYAVGLGLGLVFRSDRTIGAFGEPDLHYAAWTLAIGGLLGVGAHLLEQRAGPDDDYFRSRIAEDEELSDELKDAVLDQWDDPKDAIDAASKD